jgi:DNA-binding beta-propeller fold protein YncE
MTPPEQAPQVRAALRTIVAERGSEVLSTPAAMANLLKDLLPDDPKVVRMLVAATEDRIADVLVEHMSHGMDAATAVRIAGSRFTDASMLPGDVCAWIVGEFAIALGMLPADAGSPPMRTRPAWSAASQTRLAAGAADRVVAYVACESAAAIIPVDLAVRTASAPIVVGSWPKAIAITPDRARAYVASYEDDSLTAITITSAVAGPTIRTGSGPVAVAIAPDGAVAYVVNQDDNSVTPVTLADGIARAPITAGSRPNAIAITPDGSTAYVTNHGDGTVTPIRLTGHSSRPGQPIVVGNGPVAIVIAPDGQTGYVANHGDGTITPVNLGTGIVGPAVAVAKHPVALAVTADGATVYVVGHADGTVTPVTAVAAGPDTPPRLTPGPPIGVGRLPSAIALAANGGTAYVTNYGDGTITPLALGWQPPVVRSADGSPPTVRASGVAAQPIAVGKRPWAIAIVS